MGAAGQAAQQRLEELTQLAQIVAVGQMAGIEYHGLELRPQAGDPGLRLQPFAVEAVEGVGQAWSDGLHGLPGAHLRAPGHPPRDAGALPAIAPAAPDGQAQGIDEASAKVGVGKAEIAVAHVRVSQGTSLQVWTKFVSRSFDCGKTPSLYGSNCFRRNMRHGFTPPRRDPGRQPNTVCPLQRRLCQG